MDPEVARQLREMNEKLAGVCASMDTGFGIMRRDVHWIGRAYVPALVAAFIGLLLSVCSLVIALENRNLVLSVATQAAKNSRDLENIFPLVFPLPNITTPKE